MYRPDESSTIGKNQIFNDHDSDGTLEIVLPKREITGMRYRRHVRTLDGMNGGESTGNTIGTRNQHAEGST